jgi:hypothetical protein
LTPFKKGDLVYLHDPVYKRGIAKKFLYQYKGPFEIEQKISPLIYKICLTDGTSTIVHVNRLKRASDQAVDSKVSPLSRSSKIVKLSKRSKELAPRVKADKEIEQQDSQIPQYSQTLNYAENSSSSEESETLLAEESTADPDWTPGLSNIKRKSQNSDTGKGIAYRLRSRLVSR